MCDIFSSVSNRGIDFDGTVVGMADVGTICELSSSGVDMVRFQKILQLFIAVVTLRFFYFTNCQKHQND